ncbi:MAG: hypothetical protein II996_00040 [Oscillospiraceae bacterium]|nr:hypothetical protein [Oscillospiraceae bacterium]MBQ4543944.1 hypothetical protein [Oscillospiraceae bacterium]MBQ6901687.1 hypothetical protein [Oscillospiraceae bacterium]
MEQNNWSKKIGDFAGKYKYVIAVIAVGMLLLVFPSGNSGEVKSFDEKEISFSTEKFEKRIEKALSECDGVGRTQVILSVESGGESVYAKEASESFSEDENRREGDSDTKPSIMSEGSGREAPLLVKKIYPKFRGAVVICDGADSVSVRTDVTEAVSSLTGLSFDRISVIKMKN